MRLGIMQPYFFPNLAHFALIAATDTWVVFDVTKYTPKTWMNRNRILHPTHGWQYVGVPVEKTNSKMRTLEIRVKNLNEARETICGKLAHYKKFAPYYQEVLNLVDRVFYNSKDDSLVSLNVSCLNETCKMLGIPLSYKICSRMGLSFPEKMGPGDWAPFISRNLGAGSYVNPIGGEALFDPSDFESQPTVLYFLKFESFRYLTSKYEYVPNLSILDVLMWNSPEIIGRAISCNSSLIVKR